MWCLKIIIFVRQKIDKRKRGYCDVRLLEVIKYIILKTSYIFIYEFSDQSFIKTTQ